MNNQDAMIWGMFFHKALRKCLDSKAASIMWNAWCLLPDQDTARIAYTIYNNPMELRAAIEDAVGYGDSIRNLLRIGLEMMDDEELEVIEKYAPRPVQ